MNAIVSNAQDIRDLCIQIENKLEGVVELSIIGRIRAIRTKAGDILDDYRRIIDDED